MVKVGFGIPVLYILVQLCYGLFGSGAEYTVVPAEICEVGSGVSASGFVVRDETALPAMPGRMALCCGEGEWVGAGQTVALGFSDAADAQQERKRQRLLSEKTALEAALRDSPDTVEALVDYARGGSSEEQVQAAVLWACSDEAKLRQRISELAHEIDALTLSADTEIIAPLSGYYYAFTDGWENQLGPQALKTFPVLKEPEQTETSGKLILSNEWYYVINLPVETVRNCEMGERVAVQFAALPQITMRIATIREEANGNCVLVLKSDRDLARVATLRRASAELTFHTQRGLRIDKRSLWLNESGETGVYVLRGAQAEWKPVCLIADCGDSYLAQRDSAEDGLRRGDLVIVSDEALYDGKVIDP